MTTRGSCSPCAAGRLISVESCAKPGEIHPAWFYECPQEGVHPFGEDPFLLCGLHKHMLETHAECDLPEGHGCVPDCPGCSAAQVGSA